MPLFRYVLFALMIFSLAGVPKSLAAPKPVKAKITAQPVAKAVDLGQSVALRVVFSSPTTATCQWRRNRVPLPDATDSTYVIDAVLPEDAGSYDVLITNAAGVTASKPVVLTVNLAPASLPVDAVIYGDFTIKVPGESVSSDGAYLVTGATTLQDPEATDDSYVFSYKRLPKNKASLVISGSFYDADLGANVAFKETLSLTFTGVSEDGELLATASGKGVFTQPGGKKVNFTSTGTIEVQLTPPEEFVGTGMSGGVVISNGGGSGNLGGTKNLVGGTLTIGTGSQPGTNNYTYNYEGSNSGTATLAPAVKRETVSPSVRNFATLAAGGALVLGPGGTFTGPTSLNSGTVNLSDGLSISSDGLTTVTFFNLTAETFLNLTDGQFIFAGDPINLGPLSLDGQLLSGTFTFSSVDGTLTYSSLTWVSVP